MGLLDGLLWGGKKSNPANAAAPWLEKQQQALQPYVTQGQRVGAQYEDLSGRMANNPAEHLNQLISQYKPSEAFKYTQDQALRGLNNSAAAGGMAGSGYANEQA